MLRVESAIGSQSEIIDKLREVQHMEIKMSSQASEIKEYIDEVTDRLDEKYAKHFRECRMRSPNSKPAVQTITHHSRAGSVLEFSRPPLV